MPASSSSRSASVTLIPGGGTGRTLSGILSAGPSAHEMEGVRDKTSAAKKMDFMVRLFVEKFRPTIKQHRSRIRLSHARFCLPSTKQTAIMILQLGFVLGGLEILFGSLFGCIGLFGTVLWIWMLIDCATKETDQGNTKLIWILIIVFTHV